MSKQKKDNLRSAFTLIELLVVISIISLLSSILLVTVKNAREGARVNGAKSFDSQVFRVAGDQIVGDWEFNECSGTSTADSSGLGNNGTFVGNPTWVTNTPFGQGCAISFSGIANYIDVPNSASLSMANNFTVSLWVYMTLNSSNIFLLKGDDTICGAAPAYGFSGGFMFIANDCSNSPYNSKQGNDIAAWHQFVGVVDSNNTRSLYIDGHFISSFQSGGNSWNNNDDLWIGRGASYSANAILDEVRVYNKTLTAEEVEKLYASESKKFELATAK